MTAILTEMVGDPGHDDEGSGSAATELHGQWRLPEGGRPVPGRLVEHAGRLRLDLEGLLEVGSAEPARTLHGELLDGRMVTLLDCQLRTRSMGRPERYPERWHVGRSVIGSLLADSTDRAFSTVRLDVAGLTEAVGSSGLTLSSSDLTRLEPGRRVSVGWEATPDMVAPFDTCTLTFRQHPRIEWESDYQMALGAHVVAHLRGPEPLSLDDVDSQVTSLSSLVALATESATSTRRIELIPIADGPTSIASVRGRPWYGLSPGAEEPRFTFDALGSRAAHFIASFADFRREQPEAAELLFEYQIFNSVLTPPDRLLYLARLLEAYHRRRSPARAHFVERVAALLEGTTDAARAAYGGTASELAEAIRDTRNYYVHYDPRRRDRALHGIELDDLADRAWCAVRAVLWADFGMDDQLIGRVLDSDWRYRAACRSRLPPRASADGATKDA